MSPKPSAARLCRNQPNDSPDENLQQHDAAPRRSGQCAAGRVLVLDTDVRCSDLCAAVLREIGCEVVVTTSATHLQTVIQKDHFDLVLANLDSVDDSTFDVPTGNERTDCTIQSIFLTRAGATTSTTAEPPTRPFCTLNWPVDPDQLRFAAVVAIRHSHLLKENRRLGHRLAMRGCRELVGHSRAMQTLRRQIVEEAAHDSPLLIDGELGTGKQTIARAIHDCGERAHRPFITINCAVLTAAGMQRELFGHAACESESSRTTCNIHPGRFDLASAGSLVLQNVDETTLMSQAAIVHVLKTGAYRPLNSNQHRPLDLRLIATTRCNLHSLVRQGLFRDDLYRLLSSKSIHAPLLRDHLEDIAMLTEHFLHRAAMREGKPPKRLPPDVVPPLAAYHWPGNVRELENLIDHVCTIDQGSKLTPELVYPWLSSNSEHTRESSGGMTLKEMERKLIESTFARFSGSREKTAQALNIGLRTLSGKLREYGYPPRGGPGSNYCTSHNRAA